MTSDANIASQLKHSHEAMVQLDDELKRLQARRTQLQEHHQALLEMLSNQSSPGMTPVNTLNVSSEFVLLLALMMLVLALLYFGSWGPLVVSGIGTLFMVVTLRRRRKRATAGATHSRWAA
jgi:hypothetical protein